jgi:hypothetical protein
MPIKIVPLRDRMADDPAGVAPAITPRLTYRHGPLMTNVQVFPVFWGTKWAQQPNYLLRHNLNLFFDFVLSSALIDQLGEYSVPGQTIGHGKHVGSTYVPSALAGVTSLTDAQIQRELLMLIAAGYPPQPSNNTLYFMYIQPGIQVVADTANKSCTQFCGYHDSFPWHAGSSQQVFYAVMPYPGCSGCTGSLSVLDALTSTSSHELCEAITDPIPGQGWYDDANGEIGDICAWNTKTLGPWTVQKEWSNAAKQCL